MEYNGEEDSVDSSSGSDFEDEIMNLSDDQPDIVINAAEPADSDTDVMVPDETGVITQIISSPMKQRTSPKFGQHDVQEMAGNEGAASRVLDPTQLASGAASQPEGSGHVHNPNATDLSDSDSDSGTEYIAFTDDSGEDSEVVELRRHARKFKKRLRDSKS